MSLAGDGLIHVSQTDPEVPTRSRWKDTDLVSSWFRTVGRHVAFDRLHVVQWDLLFFGSLDTVYPSLSRRAVALSGLVPLSAVAQFWEWI